MTNAKPVRELCPVFELVPELVSGLFSDWFRHNFCHNYGDGFDSISTVVM